MKTPKFYWFQFTDGYKICCMRLSAQERKTIERNHGKIVSKTPA